MVIYAKPVHPLLKKHIISVLLVVSLHTDSFGFMCPGFEIFDFHPNEGEWNSVCGSKCYTNEASCKSLFILLKCSLM